MEAPARGNFWDDRTAGAEASVQVDVVRHVTRTDEHAGRAQAPAQRQAETRLETATDERGQ